MFGNNVTERKFPLTIGSIVTRSYKREFRVNGLTESAPSYFTVVNGASDYEPWDRIGGPAISYPLNGIDGNLCSSYDICVDGQEKGRLASAGQGQRVPGGSSSSPGKTVSATPLRPNQVAVVHDADECHDETVLRIFGGHLVRLPCSLEEVLCWFG
jgi:hypothetical protein